MISPQLRPRFSMDTGMDAQTVLQNLREQIANADISCTGVVLGRHVILKPAAAESHYWSPQLNLEVESTESGSRLHGLFGPSPNVWTLFTAMYGFLGISAVIGLLFGLSQLSIGLYASGLWVVPIALVLGAIVYFVGMTGRKLGSEQMTFLRELLESTVTATA